MKLPLHIAEQILALSRGAVIASSSAKHAIIEDLVTDEIIIRSGRVQKKLRIRNVSSLKLYLKTRLGINDLEEYIAVCKKEEVLRSDLTKVASDSKVRQVRTFKGFLINAYSPIKGLLNGKEITLHFTPGVFQFVYDFERFIPEKELTVVGIENAENFRFIESQEYLFKNIQPLFISRYPQSQSHDLVKWLQVIPNKYLHFGDFDLAGIGIYLNEFKKYIPGKSKFFVPENIEKLIRQFGNRARYDNQKMNFELETIKESDLRQLISLIHKYKSGMDQEVLCLEGKGAR